MIRPKQNNGQNGQNVQMNVPANVKNQNGNNISEDFDKLVASVPKQQVQPKQAQQPMQVQQQPVQEQEEQVVENKETDDKNNDNSNESSVVSSVSSASEISLSESEVLSSEGGDGEGGDGEGEGDDEGEGDEGEDHAGHAHHQMMQPQKIQQQKNQQQVKQPVEKFNNQDKNEVKNENQNVVESPARTWNQFFILLGVVFALFFLFSSDQVKAGLNAIPYIASIPYSEQVNLLIRGLLMIIIYVIIDKFIL